MLLHDSLLGYLLGAVAPTIPTNLPWKYDRLLRDISMILFKPSPCMSYYVVTLVAPIQHLFPFQSS